MQVSAYDGKRFSAFLFTAPLVFVFMVVLLRFPLLFFLAFGPVGSTLFVVLPFVVLGVILGKLVAYRAISFVIGIGVLIISLLVSFGVYMTPYVSGAYSPPSVLRISIVVGIGIFPWAVALFAFLALRDTRSKIKKLAGK
jgi:hypothetical protein